MRPLLKRSLVVIVAGLSVLAQAWFILALQHGGTEAFGSVWSGFGVPSSDYSNFVFRTIAWWWALPLLCLLLAGRALRRPTSGAVMLALATSLVGSIVLFASAYAPWRFVQV